MEERSLVVHVLSSVKCLYFKTFAWITVLFQNNINLVVIMVNEYRIFCKISSCLEPDFIHSFFGPGHELENRNEVDKAPGRTFNFRIDRGLNISPAQTLPTWDREMQGSVLWNVKETSNTLSLFSASFIVHLHFPFFMPNTEREREHMLMWGVLFDDHSALLTWRRPISYLTISGVL